MSRSKVTMEWNLDNSEFSDSVNETSLLAIGLAIVSRAKALCPVQEKNGGRLRNSIMLKTKDSEFGLNDSGGQSASEKIVNQPQKGNAFVGSSVHYASWVEFGTRKMAPQPYLRPAIALAKGQAMADVLKKIKEEEASGKWTKKRKKTEWDI